MSLTKKIYDLQQIDSAIQANQLTLDEINCQLCESETLHNARAELKDGEEHLAEVEKQQRDAEWEVEDMRTSLGKLSQKLYGGKVQNPKELISLEHEVGTFKDKLGQGEDKLLDLMAEAEAAQKRVELAASNLEVIDKEWQQRHEILTVRQAEVKSQLSDLDGERSALSSQIDPQVLELYEGLKSRKGQAVAKVEQGRCQGCRLNLSMSEWQRVRVGDLVQCSSCGRILYLG